MKALSVTSFSCVFLYFVTTAFASPAIDDRIELAAARQAKETVNELLLFWDEKELYVQTATRNEKPISQAAENVTVITAKEIEDMNAHSVAEVLTRVTGLFVDLGEDFGSTAFYHIQGSEPRHVLVLMDGIQWNFMGEGTAETITIPVRIVERIEIIKGPASAAWGSSLGGVINIITKETGNSAVPAGVVNASYGERDTQDHSGEIAGKIGPLGYYMFAGYQRSDGINTNRDFNNASFYSKFSLAISKDTKIGLSAGYTEPHEGGGSFPSVDLTGRLIFRDHFATLYLDSLIAKDLTLKASLYTIEQKLTTNNEVLGVGIYGSAGDIFKDSIFMERTTGGSAKLIWTQGFHTGVLGIDASHGSAEETQTAGPFLQSLGIPETSEHKANLDKLAVFVNDTMLLGNFSVTPGLRFDHNNVSGSFVSPSLGATYRLAERTILRASVARGFTSPPLGYTSLGGLFLDPNPSLKPEKVWSYQAGIETAVTDYLWAKATAFRYDVKDILVKELYAAGPPTFNDLFFNNGSITRQGFEIEAESAPLYNISLKAGATYVDIHPLPENIINGKYSFNFLAKYDDRKSFMAQISGRYIKWIVRPATEGKFNPFIWDINLQKKLFSTEKTTTEIFLTAHNIFKGSFAVIGEPTEGVRWIEAGLRFKF